MGGLRTVWGGLLLAAVLLAGAAGATDYYVDACRGSDSAGGTTPEEAWQTAARVRRVRLAPGDRVLFRRGCVWHEGLDFGWLKGEPAAPIAIGAYGEGAPPLFDGTVVPDWQAVGAGVYKAVLGPGSPVPGLLYYRGEPRPRLTVLRFPEEPAGLKPGAILLQLEGGYRAFVVRAVQGRLVTSLTLVKLAAGVPMHVRQLEAGREKQWQRTLPPPKVAPDPAGLTEPGDWLWNPDEGAVYLKSDAPPQARLARVRYGLRLVRSCCVTVAGLDFSGMSEVGVFVQGSSHVKVSDVTVRGVGSSGHKTGILLFGSSDSQVTQSRVSDVMGGGISIYAFGPPGDLEHRSWNNRISGCRVENTASAGIGLATDFPPQASLVQKNRVEGNTVLHANAYIYDAAGIYTLFIGPGNVISGNTVKNGGSETLRSAGIMLDVGSAPVLVQGNVLSWNSNGGLALTGPGHTVKDNRLEDNCAPSWDCAQLVFFPVRENAGANVTRNELTGKRLVLGTANPKFAAVPSAFDHNDYRSDRSRPFCWSKLWSCQTWLDFAAWRELGFDRYSSYRGP